MKRFLWFFGITAVSVGLDQVTKVWAVETLQGRPEQSYLGDVFRWQFARNSGAFLSLGSTLPKEARFLVFTVGVGILLLGITVYALRSKQVTLADAIGYALIVSGGGSNWFDRARFDGAVVDFMNMGLGSLRTGIFNVADLAIIAGIIVLFFAARGREQTGAAATPTAEATAPTTPEAQPTKDAAPPAKETP